jgi:hypothetical protein
MSIEKFTYRLAFVWLCFRMVADMAGRILDGLFRLAGNVLHLAFSLVLVGMLAAGAWWLWETFGDKLPI